MKKPIPGAAECIKALRWFLNLSDHDHGNLSTVEDGHNKLFNMPANNVFDWFRKHDRITELELRSATNQLFDEVRSLRSRLSEIVEQWVWDNDKLDIDPSFVTVEFYGTDLLVTLESVRTHAVRLLQLIDYKAISDIRKHPRYNEEMQSILIAWNRDPERKFSKLKTPRSTLRDYARNTEQHMQKGRPGRPKN